MGAGVWVASGIGPYVATGELTGGNGKPPLDDGDGDAGKADGTGAGDGEGVASGCAAAPTANATSAASSAVAHRHCVARAAVTLGDLLFLAAHGRREQRLITVA